MEFYKLTKDASYLKYAMDWAETFQWQICTHDGGEHNANDQLCGATYTELYEITGASNATYLADTRAIFDGGL